MNPEYAKECIKDIKKVLNAKYEPQFTLYQIIKEIGKWSNFDTYYLLMKLDMLNERGKFKKDDEDYSVDITEVDSE